LRGKTPHRKEHNDDVQILHRSARFLHHNEAVRAANYAG